MTAFLDEQQDAAWAQAVQPPQILAALMY